MNMRKSYCSLLLYSTGVVAALFCIPNAAVWAWTSASTKTPRCHQYSTTQKASWPSSSTLLFATPSTREEHADQPPNTASSSTSTLLSRRQTLSSAIAATAGVFAANTLSLLSSSTAVAAAEQVANPLKVYQLPSGLKYIELKQGNGPTPQYGQLCSIAYKGYIKLPASKENANPQPQLFGKSDAYLLKHGNGRTIPGLDEGLHTLKVGGTRRLIIPAKLGFIQTGLGPLPPSPWDRYRLNNLLDDMIRLQGGNLVYEVTLLDAIDDEADQGYYQDGSLSPEDFDTLRINIQKKAAKAAQENKDAAAAAAIAATTQNTL